jgi:type IV pilus assembly protein PilN
MRIYINLATEPYEAAHQLQRRMQLLVGGMALLAILLVAYILYQRSQTHAIDAKIGQARQEITELDNEKVQAQAILNRPANRDIADQSQFLNELFARKSLSWTRIFSEMERLVPPNLHVVSIKPDYTNNNELVVHMVVATDSRDRAVELVKRMEKSEHFRVPQVVAENVTTSGGDQGVGSGNIQFDIASVYLPEGADTANDDQKPEPEKGSSPVKSSGRSTPPATTAQNAQGGH